jgi:hypothetical protein
MTRNYYFVRYCVLKPLLFKQIRLHLAKHDLRTANISLKYDGINSMVERGYLNNLNECSSHSCRRQTSRASQRCVIRGVSAVTYRKALAVEPNPCVIEQVTLLKSTATFSYPTKYALSPKCMVSGNNALDRNTDRCWG